VREVTFRVTSKRLGVVPSKSLRPFTMTVGAITSLSSSTNPCASNDWLRVMLPVTPMSPPGSFFSEVTNSLSGLSATVVFIHDRSRGVDVKMNLGTLLMKLAKGSMSLSGQNADHSSYVRRPRITVSRVERTDAPYSSMTSSLNSRMKSVGVSATPSNDKNSERITLRISTPTVTSWAASVP